MLYIWCHVLAAGTVGYQTNVVEDNMYTRYVRKLLPIIPLICLISCQALKFYGDADKPVYISDLQDVADKAPDDSLNVVTFNIKKARKIQLAIAELKQLEKKTPVDIYLLQEMNEGGVEAIARDLGLNYLYIPFSYDKSDKKDIGNAILTRGTIEQPRKLILPHAKWQNQQRRGVTVGEIHLHEKKILVFSVHTETVAMSRKMRMDQIDSVAHYGQQEAAEYKYILIGGDFNTVFPGYSASVVKEFNHVGFDWLTAKAGSTARAMMGLVSPVNDCLFSKGFAVTNAYVIRSSRSSDHYPVFATMRY
ncbi:MAG TPA: endonuclease/exonuclease/phosphatase family protein [Puia sp.]|nr:endonuclease/exonuclease/phosphatase family protein [Puia sp.]